MNSEVIKFDYFSSVINNIKDDENLAYAATLDALYKWKESSLSFKIINDYFFQNPSISKNKLTGLILALIEFQRIHPVPEYLLDTLREIVERFIFGDFENKNIRWIKLVMLLSRRSFTGPKFIWLVSLVINTNRNLPPAYAVEVKGVIDHWAKRNKYNPEVIIYFKNAKIQTKEVIIEDRQKNRMEGLKNRRLLLKSLLQLGPSYKKIWYSLFFDSSSFKSSLLEFFKNPSIFYGFVGVTSPLFAFLGYYFFHLHFGEYFMPVLYVILIFIFKYIYIYKYD